MRKPSKRRGFHRRRPQPWYTSRWRRSALGLALAMAGIGVAGIWTEFADSKSDGPGSTSVDTPSPAGDSLSSTHAGSGRGNATHHGPVTHIVDGDTFDIRHAGETVRIRVCGIDSPERGEPGYQEGTEAMRDIIANQTLRCVQVGAGTPCDGRSNPTSYNRVVAQCFLGDRDIATEMVRRGAACDWPRFSGGHYQRVGGGNACVRR